ncbi:MAG: DUF72 domain-containing protein [Deltaproteobacteria bacterium]|nr:DUF72 domain-containing protein [Deltaproteobacteria bacterium]MBW2414004.1 DUF72 domain-containing protein [Deltaproteobacteria bacterium]
MELRTGTSGYSYDEWKGCFYPEKLPARERLAFYGEQLPAVEINNTFYRLPGANVLEHWCEQVPEGFRFVIKATRRITHSKRLKETEDETGYLLRTVATLGPRLGALLFQLPPRLRCDLPRLEKFMALLPEGTRAAFEFQHDSWRDDAVHAALRERGFALVQADPASSGEAEDLAAPTGPVDLVSTAPWGYLRLRRPDYSPADLSAWAERLRATGWDEVFVFFNHEEAGAAPRMAAEFLDVAARVFERKRPAARRPERRRKAG